MIPQVTISESPVPVDHAADDGVHGAEITFLGRVRGSENGQPIRGIIYTAYLPMARAELEKIATAMQTEYGPLPLRIHHRLGLVPNGEASLFIGVATRHSAAAFEIAAEILRRIKETVPVWKEIVMLDE